MEKCLKKVNVFTRILSISFYSRLDDVLTERNCSLIKNCHMYTQNYMTCIISLLQYYCSHYCRPYVYPKLYDMYYFIIAVLHVLYYFIIVSITSILALDPRLDAGEGVLPSPNVVKKIGYIKIHISTCLLICIPKTI